ncbi:MAG: hypothetical protein HY821_04660 [Acidobacteria bacterium]|nr:hypothetical protein [Acidobacteriota bacterium]
MDSSKLIGRAPEQLSLDEKARLAGKWVALEAYSPATLPLKRIEAIGATPAECFAELRRRQLDPRDFDIILAKPAC